MADLTGKRIIVAGGATGIGAGAAIKFVSEGALVINGDINEAGLAKLQPELEGHSGRAIPMGFDLYDDASIVRLVERCVDEFGGVDGLAVTGADLSERTLGNDRVVLDMDPEVWARSFRANVVGPGLLMKAAIPHMAKAGGGSIVVISSDASYMGMDVLPAYGSSKAALNALVRHTANLVGKDKVRVNGICPGRVINDRLPRAADRGPVPEPTNPLLRHGHPRDVARVMAFLLSDESAWITGQIISANGGSDFRE